MSAGAETPNKISGRGGGQGSSPSAHPYSTPMIFAIYESEAIKTSLGKCFKNVVRANIIIRLL